MITPVLEQLEVDFTASVKMYKINVDRSPRTKDDCGIQSIPTLLLFKQGVVVDRIAGVVSKKELAVKLNALLDET